MKYKITHEGTNSALNAYSKSLESAIDFVSKKIDTDCTDIHWVIFNEDHTPVPKLPGIFLPSLASFSLLHNNYKYGYFKKQTKEIHISEQAIESMPQVFLSFLDGALLKQHNLLIDVLIDEIAHAKTGKDHGDPIYDNLLKKYQSLCYS